jgi:hypothetical protein
VGATAAVVVAAGGGAALAVNRTAADAPRTEREAFLADVAGRLGVSVDDLRKAFREAAEARGWRAGPPLRHRPFGHGLFGPGPGHAVHEAFDAAAEYLGITREQLFHGLIEGKSLAQLAEENGKSLAQLAEENGKSLDGLEQAIRDAIVERLDAAVADGRLTEAKEQELLGRLDGIVHDLVQRSRPPRPR